MTISIKPTASGSTIEQDGSTVLSVESDRSVDIDSGTLHVDATNNRVGVGTNSPSVQLDVVGNMFLSGQSTADQFIRIGSGRTGNGYSFLDLQGDTTYPTGLRFIRLNSGANAPSRIEHSGTGSLELITQHSANIAFKTNGSNERMRIDSNGYVTMPYQPAFSVNGNQGTVTVSAGNTIPFNNVILNRGNHFSASTYKFTAPVSGVYWFNYSMYIQGSSSITPDLNGSDLSGTSPLVIVPAGDQYDQSGSGSLAIQLSAGDAFSIKARGTQQSVVYMPHSRFSGYLIG